MLYESKVFPYWFKATPHSANHTVWAMSNEPIPSPWLTDGTWHQLAVTIDQDTADGKVTGRRFFDGKPGNQAAIANQP